MYLMLLTIAEGIGAALGVTHANVLARSGPVRLDSVHRRTRIPLFALLVALLLVLVAVVTGRSRGIMWELPPSVAIIQALFQWVPMPFLLGYTATLASLLAWRERHPKRLSVTLAGVLVLAAMLILHWRLTRPVFGQLSELETTDGVVLQTSPVSCAAASGANILRLLGRPATEKEMAQTFATTPVGTSDASIMMGLRRLGYTCRKVTVTSPRDVTPPAMLFVDHPATGRESHVVVLASFDSARAEILDPLAGRLWMTDAQLQQIWHGKALEIKK